MHPSEVLSLRPGDVFQVSSIPNVEYLLIGIQDTTPDALSSPRRNHIFRLKTYSKYGIVVYTYYGYVTVTVLH